MNVTPALLAAVLFLVVPACPVLAQQSIALPARDRLIAAAPQPLFTLGKAEGAEWETFSGILGVAFDSNDQLYVLDTQSHRVVVFDRAGRFVRQFGKRGAGPGEFRFPMGLAVTSDDWVVIADIGKQAYLRYRTDGTFENSVPFAPGQQFMGELRIRSHPRGGLTVARQQPPDMAAMESNAIAGQRITFNPATQIRTEPLTASTTSTVLFVQQPKSETQSLDVGVAGMNVPMAVPVQLHFGPRLHWGVLPDGGIAVANTAPYSVQIISPSGTVTRVLTRPIEPRKVTKADRDGVIERQRNLQLPELAQLTPEARAMRDNLMKQMAANAQFAEVHPVIRELATDPSGRIWLSRNAADAKTQLIDIVGADGRYIGTVRDLDMPIAFSASGRVAHLQFDDDGVEKIVVSQLPREWQ